MSDPHVVTRLFEAELCNYTGAKFAVTTTSCTMAIQMACAYWHHVRGVKVVSMPKRSYVGVPAAVKNAGMAVLFSDEEWQGEYLLRGTTIWDSARRFTAGMAWPRQMIAVSFHWAKILSLSQGGAVLHDDPEADEWMRRYRFDGRREGVHPRDDQVLYPSVHAYLSPEVAAHGLAKLSLLPRHNADLPRSDYPDLSLMEAFK